jgi:hypothetical protein
MDRSIAGRCVITTGVFVSGWKETSPFYISREKPYNGISSSPKRERERESYLPRSMNWVMFLAEERERDLLGGDLISRSASQSCSAGTWIDNEVTDLFRVPCP